MKSCQVLLAAVCLLVVRAESAAAFQPSDKLLVWPSKAPGESSNAMGDTLPNRPGEVPPITRVVKIRNPTIERFLAPNPNGTGILILPGGGFAKVVPDMEGSEAAPFLNRLGVSVFVLSYRTNEAKPKDEPSWKRPLQDAQRSLRLIRANAKKWSLDPERIGVLGFSAGGQVASILHTSHDNSTYEPVDQIDQQPCHPDFSMLIYPWRVVDAKTNRLLSQIRITAKSPPAFIVHTHDDNSTSLGSVMIYSELKRNGVPAELHVYENGGHGYGMRSRKNSNIGTWPRRAEEWLVQRGLGKSSKRD